jgi:hypothetical protein
LAGWPGVCGFCLAMMVIALAIHFGSLRGSKSVEHRLAA